MFSVAGLCFENEHVQKETGTSIFEGTVISLGTVAVSDPKQHLNLPLQKSSL